MEVHGFQIVEEGPWGRVVTFCSRLSTVMKEHVSADVHHRFEEWRPKPLEHKGDFRGRNAEESAINPTQIEENSEGAVQEIKNVGGEMRKSGKDIMHGNARDSLKNAEDAGTSVVRGMFPPIIRFFRVVEEVLYTNVMGRTNPNYFECGTFTAVIEREILDRDTYKIRVIFDEHDLMEEVAEEIAD